MNPEYCLWVGADDLYNLPLLVDQEETRVVLFIRFDLSWLNDHRLFVPDISVGLEGVETYFSIVITVLELECLSCSTHEKLDIFELWSLETTW